MISTRSSESASSGRSFMPMIPSALMRWASDAEQGESRAVRRDQVSTNNRPTYKQKGHTNDDDVLH
eukprot:21579-Eustigmatos_ZCMA.PRE.1